VRIEVDRCVFGDQICSVLVVAPACSCVDRAILAIEQPDVAIQVIRQHGDATACLGKKEHAADAGFRFTGSRPFGQRFSGFLIVGRRGLSVDTFDGVFRPAHDFSGVVDVPDAMAPHQLFLPGMAIAHIVPMPVEEAGRVASIGSLRTRMGTVC